MPARLIELAVRARRLVAPVSRAPRSAGTGHLTARRQLGGTVTQFSFRLAFMIDLAYVGLGALGGAALGRAAGPVSPPLASATPSACAADVAHRLH
jgi:hypothetical protein